VALQITERTVRDGLCGDCGRHYNNVTGYVSRDGQAFAVYFAYCHGHPEHEAGIDVVLGTWGLAEGISPDHVTFSCLLRPQGAMAVDATVALNRGAEGPMLGVKLTRSMALAHPWAADFWAVVDTVAETDQAVHESVYKGG
jgi:hypothetical protein